MARYKLPKNIKTMNDDERYKWLGTLSDAEHDAFTDRTFKGKPEWFVYWESADGDGELEGPNIHDTEADAIKEFDEIVAEGLVVAARVEKVVGHHNVLDAGLQSRDYSDVKTFGEFYEDREEGTGEGEQLGQPDGAEDYFGDGGEAAE